MMQIWFQWKESKHARWKQLSSSDATHWNSAHAYIITSKVSLFIGKQAIEKVNNMDKITLCEKSLSDENV